MNAAVGVLIALPIMGYVFSSWRGSGWQKWTKLGPEKEVPQGTDTTGLLHQSIPYSLGRLHR